MWDGHEGHHEQKHMQIASFGNGHHDQKQQDGHIHGDNKNEMHTSLHMLGGEHYTQLEGEGQGDGLDSGKKVIQWNYKGHGHNVESGGKLGASHGEVLSGSLVEHGHMKHILNMGIGGVNGDVHNHISSGHHKGGTEIDYNHLEYAQGQVPCADYAGVFSGDHSETNAGHDHISSQDCKGNIHGGHTEVGHGFGKVSSGNYRGELGGDHSHKEYELGHVLSGDYGAEIEGGLSVGNVLSGDYEKNMAGGQNYIDSVNGHVLIGEYGGKTGNIKNYGHYGGNLGSGHNHIRHPDTYISTGDFEGEMMDGHDHMGYGHRNKGYEVHEIVKEAQPSGHQNHGLKDNESMDVLYVQYVDPKIATDLGDRNVGLNTSDELGATKHQHLHKDGTVIRNAYGDVVRDIWYSSHNSMEKDHTNFEQSFGNNHVDQ
jgi:hypothetical protein